MAPRPLSSDSATIPAASTAIDNIIYDLVTYVKRFKCPTELDFLVNNPMSLLNNEKNKPFIEQLRRLDALRKRLAKIPTHNDELLEAKHNATSMAIGRALVRMKEYQIKVYDRCTRADE